MRPHLLLVDDDPALRTLLKNTTDTWAAAAIGSQSAGPLEDQLARLAKDTAVVQTQLAAPDTYADVTHERLHALLERQATLARETHDIEAAWLEASERLEAESLQLEGD